jgi:hypothetical protein
MCLITSHSTAVHSITLSTVNTLLTVFGDLAAERRQHGQHLADLRRRLALLQFNQEADTNVGDGRQLVLAQSLLTPGAADEVSDLVARHERISRWGKLSHRSACSRGISRSGNGASLDDIGYKTSNYSR